MGCCNSNVNEDEGNNNDNKGENKNNKNKSKDSKNDRKDGDKSSRLEYDEAHIINKHDHNESINKGGNGRMFNVYYSKSRRPNVIPSKKEVGEQNEKSEYSGLEDKKPPDIMKIKEKKEKKKLERKENKNQNYFYVYKERRNYNLIVNNSEVSEDDTKRNSNMNDIKIVLNGKKKERKHSSDLSSDIPEKKDVDNDKEKNNEKKSDNKDKHSDS